MARVAGRDPDPVPPGEPTGERQRVRRRPPDSRPALLDPRRRTAQRRRSSSSSAVCIDRGHGFCGRPLLVECGVAAAAQHEPAVAQLLPVVVAVPRVVRPGKSARRGARLRAPGLASGGSRRRAPGRARGCSRPWRPRRAGRRARRARRPARARGSRRPRRRRARRDAGPTGQAGVRRRPDDEARLRTARPEPAPTVRAPPPRSRRLPVPPSLPVNRRARLRRPRAAGCRRDLSASPASRSISSSARSLSRQSARASAWPRAATASGYEIAPPRSAKPPFRPLAPPAISRASCSRTRRPRSASASAHEHPLTPPPTTIASGGPERVTAGRAGASSRSQSDDIARC